MKFGTDGFPLSWILWKDLSSPFPQGAAGLWLHTFGVSPDIAQVASLVEADGSIEGDAAFDHATRLGADDG